MATKKRVPAPAKSTQEPSSEEAWTRDKTASRSAYERSGVSIDAGNLTVELIRDAVRSTYGQAVLAGIGSFGGLYEASGIKQMTAPVLVASTDGVGTKTRLAAQAGRVRGIGQDIVNHCINDILVQGARPLFFLDYFASSHLEPEQVAEIVTGAAEACRECGVALIGGETAEMPGVYLPGEFDVAGTIVGVVERSEILPRSAQLREGDALVGLCSSGPHTNGYSLLRKIFKDTPLDFIFPGLGIPIVDALLQPHRSYYTLLYPLLKNVKALAHLTGGSFIENIPRVIPHNLDAIIVRGSWPVPPLWPLVQQLGGIAEQEMYRVFNMGIGMVAIVSTGLVKTVQDSLGDEARVIGQLVKGSGKVIIQ